MLNIVITCSISHLVDGFAFRVSFYLHPLFPHLRSRIKDITMSFHLSIVSPALPDRKSEHDIFRPTLRGLGEQPTQNNASVHVKDVVSMWQGLSPHQAREIMFWELTLRKAFESFAEEELIARFIQQGHAAGV